MSFTVPNVADAAFADQAQVDKVDLDIVIAGMRGTGVVSGGAVTTTGAANGSVAVASSELRIKHQLITGAANSALAIAANSSGNPRYDLISAGTAGTPTVTAGTAAASPVFPALPTDHAALAVVRVPNGHTTGTTIPANTIVDKRIDQSAQLARDDRGGEDFEVLVQQLSTSRVPLTVKAMDTLGTVFQCKDFADAPIAWILTTGGLYVNDFLRTTWSVFGPDPWVADIYGYVWRGKQASFVFDGPPGNMLAHTNACHQNFQGDRAATLGDWSVFGGGGTIATTALSAPYTDHPTRLSTAIRMTNTSGSTVWMTQPGGAFALSGVTAGQVYSGVAYVRSATAAAARNCSIRLQFYNDAGTQQGSDVDSSVVSIPNTGAWTKIAINGTIAPTGSTKVQIHVLMQSLNTETHDLCGVGIMKNQQTGVFAPPFVSQVAGGGPATSEGIALAGDRWTRTDMANVPGNREYVCHVGGAPNVQSWGAIDAASLYRLDADVSTTLTTAAAVSPFAVVVDANGFYALDYDLFVTSAALTTGWQLGFTGPASPTNFYASVEYESSSSAWTKAAIQSLTTFPLVTAAYVTTPNIIRIRIRAQLNNGANAGTLNLTWRSEVSGSAVVIKRGSILSVT